MSSCGHTAVARMPGSLQPCAAVAHQLTASIGCRPWIPSQALTRSMRLHCAPTDPIFGSPGSVTALPATHSRRGRGLNQTGSRCIPTMDTSTRVPEAAVWGPRRCNGRRSGSLDPRASGVGPTAVFGASAAPDQASRTQLLRQAGYEPVFSMVEMELTDLSNVARAPVPSRIRLAAARRDDVRAVWELNELVYADRPFVQVSSGYHAERFIEESGSDLSLWTLAWTNGDLAGFVISRIATQRAEVTEVGVRQEHQRSGLATALLSANLRLLRERGQRPVRLHTNGEDISGANACTRSSDFEQSKPMCDIASR